MSADQRLVNLENGSAPPVRVHAYFQHMPPYSGAAALRGASIMTAVAQLLGGKPHAVHVFTTIPDPAPLPGISVECIGVPEVENALGLSARILGELRVGWAVGRRLRKEPRCDLLVISTPGYLAALTIASFAFRSGIPFILELRDVYPEVYAAAGLISKRSWLYRFFQSRSKLMYERARLVIAATRGLAREVKNAAPTSRVQHVYNGFPSQLLDRTASQHERFTVCFHGILGFFQDIETMIDVARLLAPHDIDVDVVGYGRKEVLVRQVRLPNLRFHGRQPFEQTLNIVERCHVGMCLRMDEEISKDAFPVKVWEYLGLGIPSIVTPICEAGEFLEQNQCGFQFPAGAVQNIVERVLWLKAHPNALHELSERCRKVAAAFTREQTGLQAGRSICDEFIGKSEE